ncbi:MAG: FkbM family methyltransferase [Candidatus Levyibacteriota bacterium]
MRKFISQFIPPAVFKVLGYIRSKNNPKTKQYYPKWHTIHGGRLKGRKFLIDPVDNLWQAEILSGTLDGFMFDYLKSKSLSGKTVLDIGAHIGYHTLMFADLVGDRGKVYAFEPNKVNLERLKSNIKENSDLSPRIQVLDVALSNKDGKQEFNFSPDIENGQSSGSFLVESHTPATREDYKRMGFQKTVVKTATIDHLDKLLGHQVRPDLMKIDVEGAEYLVLSGAKKVLRAINPMVLVEVHSIYNMYRLMEIFEEVGYQMKLIKEEDRRCFFGCRSTRS